MFDRRRLSKNEFVDEIGKLCDAGESGTIFVVTGQNHQAKIILKDGNIIAAFLRPLSGVDVINSLAKERELAFSFSSIMMDVSSQVLPDTSSLLDFMKNSVGSMPGFAPPAGGGAVQIADATTVRQVLVEEATEFLGPIAGPICDEYLQKSGDPLSRQEILKVVDMLQKDINDPSKAAKFNQAVRSRLGL